MPKSVFSTHVRMYGHKDPEDILELSKIHPCIIYHITLSIFLTLKHYGIDYGIETFGELEREFSSWTIETIETLLTLNPQHLEKTIPPLDSLLMTS